LRELALAMQLPFIPIAAILTGGGLGYLIDKKFGSAPAFILLLGLLGFVVGLWEVIRLAKGASK
jgi:ATP synthase protein I